MQQVRSWFSWMRPGSAKQCDWPYPKNVNQMTDGSPLPDWLSNRVQNAVACGSCGKLCQYDSDNTGYVLSEQGWTRVEDMKKHSVCGNIPTYPVTCPAPSANADAAAGGHAGNGEQPPMHESCQDQSLINCPLLISVIIGIGLLYLLSPSSGSGSRSRSRERSEEPVLIFEDAE